VGRKLLATIFSRNDFFRAREKKFRDDVCVAAKTNERPRRHTAAARMNGNYQTLW